jgi:stage V sporulation protein AE
MDANKYKEIVDKHTPKENRLYNGMIAFGVGGLMGMLGEFLVQFYSYILDISSSEATIFMIATLIFFGHLLIHGALAKASNLGPMGLVMGMFDLISAGIIFAVFFSFIFALVFKPKD